MKGISGLKKSLAGYLGWDKRRIECFSQMLLGLSAVRTVNLQELAIGFAWAHKVGEWLAVKKPILFKQHKQQQRAQYSYFRYGFDFIRAWLFNPYAKTAQFSLFCKLLIPSSLSLEGTL